MTQPTHTQQGSIRLALSSFGAAILLAATVMMGIYLGGQTQTQFARIDTSWHDYSEEADWRGELLSRIRSHLGYGGIIHNFKNYVLRQEPVYLDELRRQLGDFAATVEEYRASGASDTELASLDAIAATIAVYESKIPIARQGAAESWSAERTDRLVKVDDTSALLALQQLDTYMRDQRDQATGSIAKSVAEGTAFVTTGFYFLGGLAVVALTIYALFFLLQNELRRTIALLSRELAERKAAEHVAKKFHRAVEQSPATIIITDTQARIEYVNAKFCELTGYTREDVVGKTPNILQSGDETPETYLALRQQLARGEEWHGTFRNLKKNGEPYWAKTIILPLRDEDDAITHFIGLGEDTTERQRAREQIHRAQKMEAVGLLASGVAHDFNNMLTTILGNVHVARQDAPKSGDLAEELAHIEIAAKRARDLVGQVLAFARRQPGKAVAVNLGEALEEAGKLTGAATQSNIAISVEVADSDMAVLADPTQLHQVLMNLCSNAAEAIGPQGGEIYLSAERIAGSNGAARQVRISIADTGPGIPEAIRGKIFDPFFTTKQAGKGTGLGLSVVANLIAEMSGNITVHGREGGGTTFRITLPETDRKRASPAIREAAPVAEAVDGVIMVIDDEPGLVSTSAKILKRTGYTVEAHTDPDAALAAFENAPDRYALVMTDFVMPEMNGEQICRAVRCWRDDCPLLIYTAYQPGAIDLDQLAPIQIVKKPASYRQLLETIDSLLHTATPN